MTLGVCPEVGIEPGHLVSRHSSQGCSDDLFIGEQDHELAQDALGLQDGVGEREERLPILERLFGSYFFFPPFFLPLGLAAMRLTPDHFRIHTF